MIDWFLWFLRKKEEEIHESTYVVNPPLSGYLRFYLPGHLFVSLLCHCKYMRVHVSHVLA